MVEIVMLACIFYASVVNEYPGPKTYTSKELYQEKLRTGNYMNVQEIDYHFTDEPQG